MFKGRIVKGRGSPGRGLKGRGLLGLAAVLVVLAGLYGGLAIFVAGRVPSNVTVDGVAVGGMSPRDATVTLRRAMAGLASRPVRLTVASRSSDVQPVEAGLNLDVDATVAGLTAFTVDPVRLWSHLTGEQNHSVTLRVDRSKLSAAVSKAARTLDRPVKQGSVRFSGTGSEVSSQSGIKVNVRETAAAVASGWPQRQVVRAVATVTPPKISEAEISRATKEIASPAMSGPVRLGAGRAVVVLQPRQFAPALSVTPDGAGKLHLRIDTPRLMAVIRTAAPGLEATNKDASVQMVGRRPAVVPAIVGRRLDGPATAVLFQAALTSPTRTLTVRTVAAPPAVTTATAAGWHIKEPISTFTTQFPVNPPRTNNIKIAVATLDGTVVRPGRQFSLNATLGERTPAKGYAKAPVIYAGRLENDFGGGVSQVSTTTFNAAFFAGVRIDQHTPHSFYISRYPEGREATLSWPGVDQRWTNDTGSGILIQAQVQGNSITVTFWGTKAWDVVASKGLRRHLVNPRTIVDPRPTCVPQVPTPGFDVTVTQIFRKNGSQVSAVPFNTHYIPEDNVKCTHPAP